jgi:hypothetical protein
LRGRCVAGAEVDVALTKAEIKTPGLLDEARVVDGAWVVGYCRRCSEARG